ncbi:MAG: PfkB family carbohydrate kinase, partial [Alphaproteobacteria bacterium]
MIVVFGSINVDLVVRVAALPRPGETVLAPSYDAVAGGKGANQAVAAARAGAAVRMVGCVGRD